MNEIEKAKAVLKENGYFTDNLWTVNDVKDKFRCTDEQAQEILNKSLTNEATMEQIQFSIIEFSEMNNLEKIICDKNGDELAIEDSVEVDEPSKEDLHQHSFIGNIKTFRNGNVVVEDMDGDCFEVEGDKIELTKDKY